MIEKLQQLESRIAFLEALLSMTLRIGEVVARDPKTCRAKVQFKDAESIVTYWCFVVLKKTHKDKEFWLPDVGEMVVCIFPYFDQKHGYILGSVYNDKDLPPTFAGPGQYVLHDKSGNVFLMDRQRKQFYLIAEQVNVVGNLRVTGNVAVGKKIWDERGNLTDHVHLCEHCGSTDERLATPGPGEGDIEDPGGKDLQRTCSGVSCCRCGCETTSSCSSNTCPYLCRVKQKCPYQEDIRRCPDYQEGKVCPYL
jgi:phage baseplate assembly protein gpV